MKKQIEIKDISLLDYFAGQALTSGEYAETNEKLAVVCYDIAEELLKEREKRNK